MVYHTPVQVGALKNLLLWKLEVLRLHLSWQKKNRVLIHIADAPAHGSRFNGGCDDYYAAFNDKDPRGLVMEDLISNVDLILDH